MRPIDADALKELFSEVIGHIAKKPEMNGNLEHMVRASAMVIQMIDDAPTVQLGTNLAEVGTNLVSKQPEQRWIPVEERLPEPWTLVLVTDSCKNVTVCQMGLNPSDGWYDECENWMYFSTSVIAWMPLPEPYQERGEQE